MNAIRNNVQLIGNVGATPEIKTLESGKSLAKISLATHEVFRNANGERVTETQWHNLIVWGKQSDIVSKFIHKGSEIAVNGKLCSRSYIDNTGNKKFITEIEVSEIQLLGRKKAA